MHSPFKYDSKVLCVSGHKPIPKEEFIQILLSDDTERTRHSWEACRTMKSIIKVLQQNRKNCMERAQYLYDQAKEKRGVHLPQFDNIVREVTLDPTVRSGIRWDGDEIIPAEEYYPGAMAMIEAQNNKDIALTELTGNGLGKGKKICKTKFNHILHPDDRDKLKQKKKVPSTDEVPPSATADASATSAAPDNNVITTTMMESMTGPATAGTTIMAATSTTTTATASAMTMDNVAETSEGPPAPTGRMTTAAAANTTTATTSVMTTDNVAGTSEEGPPAPTGTTTTATTSNALVAVDTVDVDEDAPGNANNNVAAMVRFAGNNGDVSIEGNDELALAAVEPIPTGTNVQFNTAPTMHFHGGYTNNAYNGGGPNFADIQRLLRTELNKQTEHIRANNIDETNRIVNTLTPGRHPRGEAQDPGITPANLESARFGPTAGTPQSHSPTSNLVSTVTSPNRDSPSTTQLMESNPKTLRFRVEMPDFDLLKAEVESGSIAKVTLQKLKIKTEEELDLLKEVYGACHDKGIEIIVVDTTAKYSLDGSTFYMNADNLKAFLDGADEKVNLVMTCIQEGMIVRIKANGLRATVLEPKGGVVDNPLEQYWWLKVDDVTEKKYRKAKSLEIISPP